MQNEVRIYQQHGQEQHCWTMITKIILLSPDDIAPLCTPRCTSELHAPKHHKHMTTQSVLERATLRNRVLPLLNQRMKLISFCLLLYHPRRSFSSFLTQSWSMHFCLEALPLLFQSQQPLEWRLQILQNSCFSSDENITGTRQITCSCTSGQSKSVMYCSFFAKGWDWGSFVSFPFVSPFFCSSLLCVGHVPLDGYCFQLFISFC